MRARFNKGQFNTPVRGRGLHILRILLYFAALYGAGIVAGMVAFLALPTDLRGALAQSVHTAAQAVARTHYYAYAERLEVIQNTFFLLLLWLGAQLPALPLGAPLLYACFFIRAASVGACASALIAVFGWRGAGFDLLALIPWNILSAVGFIIAVAAGLAHHRKMRKADITGITVSWWWQFHGLFMAALFILIGAGDIEAHIAGPLARLFTL